MSYQRYTIHTEVTPNLTDHPPRFEVRVNRIKLATLLLGEILEACGNLRVVTNRPCVYGVFSGPVGGFLPRPQHCVGCLRCTVQYPQVVQIHRGRKRLELGDSYFDPDKVDTVVYEATTGRIPVRGAGYGGPFGGKGWDGMWTDMSEIVRPTRDGIHGREFISTAIDLGAKPLVLSFDSAGRPVMESSRWKSLSIPSLLELPPIVNDPARLAASLHRAAVELDTRLVIPLQLALDYNLDGHGLAPVLNSSDIQKIGELKIVPDVIELVDWNADIVKDIRARWPLTVIGMRAPFGVDVVELAKAGVDFIHLLADFHGRTSRGFILEAIRESHLALVAEGIREGISLIGSGGIVAAEHMPKAIICGLDGVALDTPLLIALQGQFIGEVRSREKSQVMLPEFPIPWGTQRVLNLIGSWRDQMLEILGAMGLREVRRLRGEIGRAMFQAEMEQEAFAEIDGFEGAIVD